VVRASVSLTNAGLRWGDLRRRPGWAVCSNNWRPPQPRVRRAAPGCRVGGRGETSSAGRPGARHPGAAHPPEEWPPL